MPPRSLVRRIRWIVLATGQIQMPFLYKVMDEFMRNCFQHLIAHNDDPATRGIVILSSAIRRGSLSAIARRHVTPSRAGAVIRRRIETVRGAHEAMTRLSISDVWDVQHRLDLGHRRWVRHTDAKGDGEVAGAECDVRHLLDTFFRSIRPKTRRARISSTRRSSSQ
jgi:hypothetical protein